MISRLAVRARSRNEQIPSGWRERLDVRRWPAARQFLLALLVIYVAKAAITVIVFPPFTGHDEVAHYSYVRTVATERRLPRLPDGDGWRIAFEKREPLPGDWIPDDLYRYCRYVLDWQQICYPDEDRWRDAPPHVANWPGEIGLQPAGYQYAATHPPLYYLLMTPIYWATERASASPATQQYLMRFAAIPFGLATVILAYLLARVLFPGDAFLAITVPTFVAFQPQISYEAAMVNNDILCIALVSWVLYLLVVGLRDRFPLRLCAVTGFAFGLALLAKGTSLTAAPLIALAIILGVGLLDVRGWALRGGIVAGVAALISWPWFLFLYRAYGNFDGFDQIAQLQYWNYQHRDKPSIPDLLFNRDFAELRWKETWGEFGWRRIHLSGAMLWAIGIPCLVALAGLVRYAVLLFRSGADVIDPVLRPRQWQRRSIGLLAATVVVAYFAIVQFGTRFELTQARYFFPAINAVALLLMLGLRALIPRQWRTYGQAGVLLALLLLNALIFTQYVVPYWHFSPR